MLSAVFVVAAALPWSECSLGADCTAPPTPEVTVTLSDARYVSITVRNSDPRRGICIFESDWPRPIHVDGDPFIVRGASGKAWTFVGVYFSPSETVRRLQPGRELSSGQIDLNGRYNSDVPGDRIASVTWQAPFWYCDCPPSG